MKKLKLSIVLSAGLLLTHQLMAQNIKSSLVPQAVTKALISKYPEANKISWEKESGNYEANWGGKSGEDMSVQFTPAGVYVQQVKAIDLNQLPAAVKQYAAVHYKGSKIKEPGKVTDAAGKISYEVEIKGKDVLFDEQGKFIKEDKD